MTLKIQMIRLRNWKCYRDETIRFENVEDRNIWIVFGQNGFGKTSLLEAIQWCLYGTDAVSNAELATRFNRVAVRNDPRTRLSVHLTFDSNGKIYNVSRVAQRNPRGTAVTVSLEEPTVNIDGVNQADVRERIEELLPRSCREFFFFDGVEIKRYAQRVQKDETRDSIERVLGIPELRNLRDDAERAMGMLDDRMSEASLSNEELTRINASLDEKGEEIATLEDQLAIAKEQLGAAISIKDSIEVEAGQLEVLRTKIDEISRLDREIARTSDSLNEIEVQIEAGLQQAAIPLLLGFIREVSSDLQRASITASRRAGSYLQLKALLEGESCICGRLMDDEAKAHIQKELGRLNVDENVGKESILQDTVRADVDSLSRYQRPDFDSLMLRRDRITDELEELKQARDRLRQETGDISVDREKEIWKKVGEAEAAIKEKEEAIKRFNEALGRLKQEDDNLRRERERSASQQEGMAELVEQVRVVRGLFLAAKELIEWRVSERKETIERHTSAVHRRVTNKPDEYVGVVIGSDYSLRIMNVAGDALDPETLSAGEREALAFAFIAGLNLASGTAAPFVMDTPFGHLDTDHQRNLVRSLPELPSQVLVLATDRDLPDNLLREVRPHVAEILKIRRLGATEDASTVEVIG
ncbi:MAG TPA: AAA family ATPase [Pyrinomonadaceae bacterium]|jgi:DNA sulfur modification protein DndD